MELPLLLAAHGKMILGEAGVIILWVLVGVILMRVHVMSRAPLVVGEILLLGESASQNALAQTLQQAQALAALFLDVFGSLNQDGVKRKQVPSVIILLFRVTKALAVLYKGVGGRILAGVSLLWVFQLVQLQAEEVLEDQWEVNATNMMGTKVIALTAL